MAQLILWNGFAGRLPERNLGVYQIANWLRGHGYTIKIIDFCNFISTDRLVELTQEFITSDTIGIGVSSTFWSNEENPAHNNTEPNWIHQARLVLEPKYPNLNWVLGGSRSYKRNFKHTWVRFHDYAEDSVLAWMDSKFQKFTKRTKYDIVDHHGFTFEKEDMLLPFEVLPIELSRGCRFECSFCKFPLLGKTPGTYIRTHHSIREELIRNYNEFGTTNYNVMCDTYNESPEKVQMIHEITQSLPFQINFTAYVRLDLLAARPEQIKMLQESGLRSAFFGIESFHPKGSMVVGKGWNGKKAKDFLLQLKEQWGNRTTWQLGFIVGLPGDTPDTVEETYEWLVKNKMYCWDFSPLGLSASDVNEAKSKFERESEKYGFKMTGRNTWENDIWTSETAIKVADALNKKSVPIMSPGAFQVSKFINLNYSYDHTLHSVYGKNLDAWPDINERKKKFIINYFKKQFELTINIT